MSSEVRGNLLGTLVPNKHSKWKIVDTYFQSEVECGARMGYHMYLAAFEELSYDYGIKNDTKGKCKVRTWFKKCCRRAEIFKFENVNERVQMQINLNEQDDEDDTFFFTPSTKLSGGGSMKRKRCTKYCCFAGCDNHNGMMRGAKALKLTRIPQIVVQPKDSDRHDKWKTYDIKKTKRAWQLRRCGLKPTDERKDLRICPDHEIEEKVFTNHEYKDGKGTKRKHSFRIKISSSRGMDMEPKRLSKGLGRDR